MDLNMTRRHEEKKEIRVETKAERGKSAFESDCVDNKNQTEAEVRAELEGLVHSSAPKTRHTSKWSEFVSEEDTSREDSAGVAEENYVLEFQKKKVLTRKRKNTGVKSRGQKRRNVGSDGNTSKQRTSSEAPKSTDSSLLFSKSSRNSAQSLVSGSGNSDGPSAGFLLELNRNVKSVVEEVVSSSEEEDQLDMAGRWA